MARSVFRVKGPDIKKAILQYATAHLKSVGGCACADTVRKAGGLEAWDLNEETTEYVFIDVEFDAEAT